MTTPAFGAPQQQQAQPAFGAREPAFGGQQAPQQQQAASGSPWSTPSQIPDAVSGDKFEPAKLVNALLLFKPTEYVTGLTTTFTKAGETTDMVRADVTVVGAQQDSNGNWITCAPEQSAVLHDAGIFQGRLIAKLKGLVGIRMALGRLTTAPTSGNPAYELSEPSAEDQAAAMQWYQSHQEGPPF